ncbi:Zn(2)-C6 fungal-type domain-containing protein [Mycena chlorophos]|uniref:Zn(2)-C6 fungal-type domain-containing protein n=1 Tax=Mycena chlorophos TaxID=658473 RepID=A0A8H6SUG5_MYCCL|nr:Zn(2)-C6 fungal-type domain-containing protein [Mycena chlorophos]
MTDALEYPSNAYMDHHSDYYSSPPLPQSHGHGHHHSPHSPVAPSPRQETTTRKRPKYTRSKTGCLTCRVKKIKCDEAKPVCMRCAHGQRDCNWPDGAPARKRSVSSKDSPGADSSSNGPSTAPSTASPGISESSSPTSTRGHSPPERSPIELNLPPLLSTRRQESAAYHLPPMHHPSQQIELEPPLQRRDYDRRRYSPPTLIAIPDVQQHHPQHHHPQHYSRQYQEQQQPNHTHYAVRYEPYQSNNHVAIPRAHSSSLRGVGHAHMGGHWSPPPPLMNPSEQYYHPPQRALVDGDHMARY